jgi:hypothetical protein
MSNFSKDRDTAIKVNAGATLTAVRNTFVNNTAYTGALPEEKIGGGPHIGIYAGEQDPGSAIIWDCDFGNYSAAQPKLGQPVDGDVKVENQMCLVLSDHMESPEVFDEALLREISPWWLQPVPEGQMSSVQDSATVKTLGTGDTPNTSVDKLGFLFETDDNLAVLVNGQSEVRHGVFVSPRT